MLRSISVKQFSEWRAYADLEPFDETRGDIRSAQIVAKLHNLNRKRGSPAIRIKDCMLRFEPEEIPQSPEARRSQIVAAMRAMAAKFGPRKKPAPKRAKR